MTIAVPTKVSERRRAGYNLSFRRVSCPSIRLVPPDAYRRGGIAGEIVRFGMSSGLSRKTAGYLSGFVFASGSVERQVYRQVAQPKTAQAPATGDALCSAIVDARQRGQAAGVAPCVVWLISAGPSSGQEASSARHRSPEAYPVPCQSRHDYRGQRGWSRQ
jgi:hypothetical protein